jgi:hypothetical protein
VANVLSDVIEDLRNETRNLNPSEARICYGIELGTRLEALSRDDPDFAIFRDLRNDFIGHMGAQLARPLDFFSDEKKARGEQMRLLLQKRGRGMTYAMRVRLARRLSGINRRRKRLGVKEPRFLGPYAKVHRDLI